MGLSRRLVSLLALLDPHWILGAAQRRIVNLPYSHAPSHTVLADHGRDCATPRFPSVVRPQPLIALERAFGGVPIRSRDHQNSS
jgi:hypothetical protein